MSTATQNSILRKLLLLQRKGRMRTAWVVLCAGTTLLLLSVLAWWNFSILLSGDSQGNNATSTFIVIGKLITEQNMGNASANSFSENETADLLRAPQVQDVGEITPALFPVYAIIGGRLAMSTDLPLESVPDRFLDTLPGDWNWQPGNRNLPVILSSQFFDIYNYVFAPGQGLPQLSRQSVRSIGLKLQVGGDGGTTLSAHVSGFSDRIGSVLAPQSFIEHGNRTYAAPGISRRPSQLILKVKDPSDTHFTGFLQQHGYTANPQNLRWSRMRTVVETVTSATGILALLLMGISTLVFVLFIELTIAKSHASLVLLRELGYSKAYLHRFMSGHFLPMIAGAVLLAMLVCVSAQVIISMLAVNRGLVLPTLPGWPVWTVFGTSIFVLLLLVRKAVSSAING